MTDATADDLLHSFMALTVVALYARYVVYRMHRRMRPHDYPPRTNTEEPTP